MALVRILAAAFAVALATHAAAPAAAAPRRAEIVIDALTGATLHARDADARLPPASLTKMMTLYMVFEAVRQGRLTLDQQVPVSARAAGQAPTKIGLRAGQRARVRDLVRAAAIRSANDAAVALAEAVGGTESRFAELMTRRARDLGMTGTTFRNATGFTAAGHLSTARDMAHLGRRLFEDFPEHYDLFGRRQVDVFGRTLTNTNKLLASYRGADGIKTGYTRAAGFNLVASAERDGRRVIAALFGGSSGASRNARVAELLDLGFRGARPGGAGELVAAAETARAAARGLARAPAPTPRPGPGTADLVAAATPAPRPLDAAEIAAVDQAVTAALAEPLAETEGSSLFARGAAALGRALGPSAARAAESPALPDAAGAIRVASVSPTAAAPRRAPAPTLRAGDAPAPVETAALAMAPGGDWSVQLGAYAEREVAVARLAAAAFGVMPALAAAGREIHVASLGGQPVYRARLTGLDAGTAREACRRLERDGGDCLALPPGR